MLFDENNGVVYKSDIEHVESYIRSDENKQWKTDQARPTNYSYWLVETLELPQTEFNSLRLFRSAHLNENISWILV